MGKNPPKSGLKKGQVQYIWIGVFPIVNLCILIDSRRESSINILRDTMGKARLSNILSLRILRFSKNRLFFLMRVCARIFEKNGIF